MESVGIRKLKDHLSRYLKEVQEGREVLVTERGRAVAKIVPVLSGEGGEAESLFALASQGLVHLPESTASQSLPELLKIKGGPVSDTVLEGRR
jgi:prevent-host-death family protein